MFLHRFGKEILHSLPPSLQIMGLINYCFFSPGKNFPVTISQLPKVKSQVAPRELSEHMEEFFKR